MIGIYLIKNKIDNKIYVGSSKNIERRFKKHRTELNTGRHSNQFLAKAYKKFGQNSFDFIIIELCKEDNLIDREIFYINYYDSLNPKKGYNLKSPVYHPSNVNKQYSEILSKAKKGITPQNFIEMQKTRWSPVEVYVDDVLYKRYDNYNQAERDLGMSKGYIFSYFKYPNIKRRKYQNLKFKRI